MLRDKNLVPLSHQHQHALALCVRIGKAFAESGETPDVHPWEREIVQLYDAEIRYHFEAEERFLFPAAEQIEELRDLVDELRIEHGLLRKNVERARARDFTATDLQVFSASLSEHVRKEERDLFECMQKLIAEQELNRIGSEMNSYFAESAMPGASCSIPEADKT